MGGSITEIVYALRGKSSRRSQVDELLPESRAEGARCRLHASAVGAGCSVGQSVQHSGLAWQGAKEAIDVLTKSNGPFIELPGHHRHKGVLESCASSARRSASMPKAEKLALEMDAKLKAAEKRQTAAIKERNHIVFVLSAQDGKIFAAGSDTAGDGIIELSTRSRVSPATADVRGGDRHCQADVILPMKNAGPPISEDELFANPSIASTHWHSRTLISMDGG